MHQLSVHGKQKSRAISDISQPHRLAHTQLKPRDNVVCHCLVKGDWKMAKMHLKACFVHLLQICHKGCALPPQDVL